jgi:hypothetical protein
MSGCHVNMNRRAGHHCPVMFYRNVNSFRRINVCYVQICSRMLGETWWAAFGQKLGENSQKECKFHEQFRHFHDSVVKLYARNEVVSQQIQLSSPDVGLPWPIFALVGEAGRQGLSSVVRCYLNTARRTLISGNMYGIRGGGAGGSRIVGSLLYLPGMKSWLTCGTLHGVYGWVFACLANMSTWMHHLKGLWRIYSELNLKSEALLCAIGTRVESEIDGQSASSSWCRTSLWGPWPHFKFSLTRQFLTSLCMAPSLTRGRYFSVHITYSPQSRRTGNYIFLSHLRLPQLGGPGPHIYFPQDQVGPVILPSTGITFSRLLRQARLRLR